MPNHFLVWLSTGGGGRALLNGTYFSTTSATLTEFLACVATASARGRRENWKGGRRAKREFSSYPLPLTIIIIIIIIIIFLPKVCLLPPPSLR